MAAEMSVVESNTALLTWCPAPDSHLRPASHYLLERREAPGGEWVQCLATDLPSCVRVLGDSVPREADYCFRISAANKHGRSSPVEFPGSVHLGEETGKSWDVVCAGSQCYWGSVRLCYSPSSSSGEGSAGHMGEGW